MVDTWGEMSPERPILLGSVSGPTKIRVQGGGSTRVHFADRKAQVERVDRHIRDAFKDLSGQVQLSASLPATDPELVLIFEALDERVDLESMASKMGFEVLTEVDSFEDPTDEFQLLSDKTRNPTIGSCIHAVCVDSTSLLRIQKKWKEYKASGQVRGNANLRDLFSNLKDVRPWGPADRVKSRNWDLYFSERINAQNVPVEIELWYRRSAKDRQKAESSVLSLVREAGGSILASAVIESIGYHAIKCNMPISLLRELAAGNHESIQLIKSSDVMYFRVSGQTISRSEDFDEPTEEATSDLPSGEAILCLLDGVPAANHRLLAGRTIVLDPDDLSENAEVSHRRHGTAMASVAIWGDLSERGAASNRPVIVRPILAPSSATQDSAEEIRDSDLPPDLMQRVFRELFETNGEIPAAAPEVAIINMSIGDPSTMYDTAISSWARILDWLSYEYGVLLVISAGNHPRLPLNGMTDRDVADLEGEERRRAVVNAQIREQAHRRLLSPAESINAITVGASHHDSSAIRPIGYSIDPMDGLPATSPISAIGGGYRRSVKPEVSAPGGKVVFRDPFAPEQQLDFFGAGVHGPGIRVASPEASREMYAVGTSPAAALVSRRAASTYDLVSAMTAASNVSRRQRVSATKALLLHGARADDGYVPADFSISRLRGYGELSRDFTLGCAQNEAVVLFTGSLGAAESRKLLVPLPDGLGVRDIKRVTATLAWLSPVNWRHRQYRSAALSFTKPSGALPSFDKATDVSSDDAKRGAATSQHLSWETEKAFPLGQGSNLEIVVKCLEQAGGLHGRRIDFGVAVTLWVAPALNVDVYSQVRDQIRPRVRVGR